MEVNLSRKSTLYNTKIFLVYSSVCEHNGLTVGLCSNSLTAHFRGKACTSTENLFTALELESRSNTVYSVARASFLWLLGIFVFARRHLSFASIWWGILLHILFGWGFCRRVISRAAFGGQRCRFLIGCDWLGWWLSGGFPCRWGSGLIRCGCFCHPSSSWLIVWRRLGNWGLFRWWCRVVSPTFHLVSCGWRVCFPPYSFLCHWWLREGKVDLV